MYKLGEKLSLTICPMTHAVECPLSLIAMFLIMMTNTNIIVMKKFLTISMMALAVVFASSCEKDENPAGETNTNYVNTWVDENIPAAEVLSYADALGFSQQLPAEVKQFLATKPANLKFTAVANLAADETGNVGILVKKSELNILVATIEAYLEDHASEIDQAELAKIQGVMTKLEPVLEGLNDLDYVGMPFTYTVAPADATSGEFTFTAKIGKEDKSVEASYSNLSETTLTITGSLAAKADKVASYTLDLKSAASAKIAVGKFVDASTIAAGLKK